MSTRHAQGALTTDGLDVSEQQKWSVLLYNELEYRFDVESDRQLQHAIKTISLALVEAMQE
jgi:hypothetical protein